jgi:predicted aspartyl protease
MGQIRVQVRLRNARDVVMARLGHLPETQIHTYETTEALIDTGAMHPVIPPHVAEHLGLVRLGYTGAQMADGRLIEGEMTEPILFELLRRQVTLGALVLGQTILLGAMVLEGLDLAVDCARGQLMPNLGTWDQPVFRV